VENQLEHPAFSQLVKYLFGELAEEDNEALDRLLLKEEYYYDIVQNLMQYCDQHNIYNRAALEKEIERHKSKLFVEMKTRGDTISSQDSTKPAPKPTLTNTTESSPKSLWTSSKLFLILFLFVLVTATGWYVWGNYISPPIPPPPPANIASVKTPEMGRLLNKLWTDEKDALGGAGKDNWEDAFKQERFDSALVLLEKEIQNPEAAPPKLLYFAGIQHLYLRNGSPEKALDYLIRAKGFRNDKEYEYSKHLIIALASNKKYREAAQLLDSFLQYKEAIPQDMLSAINASKK
jgi:tetratricopeptide (TPR) repeat protein